MKQYLHFFLFIKSTNNVFFTHLNFLVSCVFFLHTPCGACTPLWIPLLQTAYHFAPHAVPSTWSFEFCTALTASFYLVSPLQSSPFYHLDHFYIHSLTIGVTDATAASVLASYFSLPPQTLKCFAFLILLELLSQQGESKWSSKAGSCCCSPMPV